MIDADPTQLHVILVAGNTAAYHLYTHRDHAGDVGLLSTDRRRHGKHNIALRTAKSKVTPTVLQELKGTVLISGLLGRQPADDVSHKLSSRQPLKGKEKERKSIYIAPFRTKVHTKRSGMDHTVFTCKQHHACLSTLIMHYFLPDPRLSSLIQSVTATGRYGNLYRLLNRGTHLKDLRITYSGMARTIHKWLADN